MKLTRVALGALTLAFSATAAMAADDFSSINGRFYNPEDNLPQFTATATPSTFEFVGQTAEVTITVNPPPIMKRKLAVWYNFTPMGIQLTGPSEVFCLARNAQAKFQVKCTKLDNAGACQLGVSPLKNRFKSQYFSNFITFKPRPMGGVTLPPR